MKRTETRQAKIGRITIGGQNKVLIQSMCKHKTSHVEEVVKEINECAKLGADMMRVSCLLGGGHWCDAWWHLSMLHRIQRRQSRLMYGRHYLNHLLDIRCDRCSFLLLHLKKKRLCFLSKYHHIHY